MSFGFSVGDFIAVGKLAYDLTEACKNASDDYKDLGDLCRAVSFAVEACRPNDPFTVLRKQNVETISILAADCESTLNRLQDLLISHRDMNTIRNIGRKIGFVSAKQERSDIRARLQEHLSAINTFLTGVQMETLGLTVKLVMKMLEGRNEGFGDASLHNLIEDPEKLDLLLNDFGSESKIAQAELRKNQDVVKERLKAAVDQKPQARWTSLINTSSTISESSSQPQDQTISAGYAKASVTTYNPAQIPWFSKDAWSWLRPVSPEESCFMEWKVPSSQIRYSEQDEYLSIMPEGWAIVPTLLKRDSILEEAHFYVFNNLSFAPDNVPRTSRAYCVTNPFLSDADDASQANFVHYKNLHKFVRKPNTRFYQAEIKTDYPIYTENKGEIKNIRTYFRCTG